MLSALEYISHKYWTEKILLRDYYYHWINECQCMYLVQQNQITEYKQIPNAHYFCCICIFYSVFGNLWYKYSLLIHLLSSTIPSLTFLDIAPSDLTYQFKLPYSKENIVLDISIVTFPNIFSFHWCF